MLDSVSDNSRTRFKVSHLVCKKSDLSEPRQHWSTPSITYVTTFKCDVSDTIGTELGCGFCKDVFSPPHYADRCTMETQLSGNFEPNSRSTASYQCSPSAQNCRLERRFRKLVGEHWDKAHDDTQRVLGTQSDQLEVLSDRVTKQKLKRKKMM